MFSRLLTSKKKSKKDDIPEAHLEEDTKAFFCHK